MVRERQKERDSKRETYLVLEVSYAQVQLMTRLTHAEVFLVRLHHKIQNRLLQFQPFPSLILEIHVDIEVLLVQSRVVALQG